MASVSAIRMPKRVSIGLKSVRTKRKRWAVKPVTISARTASVGILVICLLSLVAVTAAITKSEHRLMATQQQNRKLLVENRGLQKEWEYLTSPARIEQLAKRELGLQPPYQEQLVVVRY